MNKEKKIHNPQCLQTLVLFLFNLLRWGRLRVYFDKPFPPLPPFYLRSPQNLRAYLIPVGIPVVKMRTENARVASSPNSSGLNEDFPQGTI